MDPRALIKEVCPPVLLRLARRWVRSRGDWSVVPDFAVPVRGWYVDEVAATYRRNWPEFVEEVRRGDVLGIPPDALRREGFDLAYHNTVMCFGHALGTAANGRSEISMLDWGCALGHYRVLAGRLQPSLRVDYLGRDLAPMVRTARDLQPDAAFTDCDECFDRSFDFVMASTSLHYEEDWAGRLAQLGRASRGWLYITGLPVVQDAASFAFSQKAHAYGYNTEYVGWCLNRHQFLAAATQGGVTLAQEYVLGYRPVIVGAPEQCEYRGFLFRKSGIIR